MHAAARKKPASVLETPRSLLPCFCPHFACSSTAAVSHPSPSCALKCSISGRWTDRSSREQAT
eukprot:779918-Pleurochrysis_carterae.AAC.1